MTLSADNIKVWEFSLVMSGKYSIMNEHRHMEVILLSSYFCILNLTEQW